MLSAFKKRSICTRSFVYQFSVRKELRTEESKAQTVPLPAASGGKEQLWKCRSATLLNTRNLRNIEIQIKNLKGDQKMGINFTYERKMLSEAQRKLWKMYEAAWMTKE